jgi:phage-related protein
MRWTIEYYVTADGKCPVREFIDGLSYEGQAKYIFITRLLTEYGILVKEPYVKQFTGHKKLFEMRIKDKTGISRILYFTHTGRKFVLLHGFAKKTNKTPQWEIEIAEERMKDYLSREV